MLSVVASVRFWRKNVAAHVTADNKISLPPGVFAMQIFEARTAECVGWINGREQKTCGQTADV
jgi:hypothetical protein